VLIAQRPSLTEEVVDEFRSRFVIEPLEPGFGYTLGNSLRRTLLSSIPGAAITMVRFDDALHEFDTIGGVTEDVTDIILNLKEIPVRMHVEGPKIVTLDVKGPRVVTAADLAGDPQVEIVDPSRHIATVNEEGHLRMELQIKHGRGYVAIEKNLDETLGLGWVPLDSVHSPVRRVNYKVETARVGRMTDYEKLTLDVWTNGTVTPEEAISLASTLLQEHLAIFVSADEMARREIAPAPADAEMEALMAKNLDDFDLSVRTANCLKNAAIATVGDLVGRSERDILEIKNFGKKSLEELQELLARLGLSFGMSDDAGAGA
jgi:DNA-directed RNA polymerase subunit alpha